MNLVELHLYHTVISAPHFRPPVYHGALQDTIFSCLSLQPPLDPPSPQQWHPKQSSAPFTLGLEGGLWIPVLPSSLRLLLFFLAPCRPSRVCTKPFHEACLFGCSSLKHPQIMLTHQSIHRHPLCDQSPQAEGPKLRPHPRLPTHWAREVLAQEAPWSCHTAPPLAQVLALSSLSASMPFTGVSDSFWA